MAEKRLLIRCDAAPWLGGGHVMRCLTLAGAVAARGWQVVFASTPETAQTIPALGRSGFRVIPLEDPQDAAECVVKAGSGWDAVLVDQYALGPEYETALRAIAGRVAVIDDLLRVHDCDLLVDPTHGRAAQDYAGLVPASAHLACGAEYALLRPEFAAQRAEALTRRDGCARSLLISLGLTDVGGITGQVLEQVLPVFDGQIDVVLGAGAESRERVVQLAAQAALPSGSEVIGQTETPSSSERSRAVGQTRTRHARVTVHVDTPDVAALMTQADLAIGAGGTTSWERCALGLPTLLFVLADNQRDIAQALQTAGAVQVVDLENVAAVLAALTGDPAQVQTMGRAAAAICDGAGVARVRTLLEEIVA